MAIDIPLTEKVAMAHSNYPNGEGGYGSSQSGRDGDYRDSSYDNGGYGSLQSESSYQSSSSSSEESAYVVSSSSEEHTTGYRYSESVIPVGRRVFVLGAVSDSSGMALISKPSNSKYKYIISTKSEEQVAKEARGSANTAFYGMLASFAISFLLVFFGLLSSTPTPPRR